MDIQTLRVFLGLCRNLHFAKTSEEFHISASALSRLVQRLESTVGHPLFIRDNRSVKLTEQGRLLRQYALETVANWQQLQTEMNQTELGLSGTLTLFASVTASQSILPNVLTRFRQEFPNIHIQLETGYAVNALQRLGEGCDVVVAALSMQEEPLFEKKIVTSTPVIAISSNSVDVAPDPIDWSAVPVILPSYGSVRDKLDSWYASQGFKPNVYTEVAGNEAILSLVALGCGVGFVPRLVLENSALVDRIKVLEGGPSLEAFHVGFCTRKKDLEKSSIISAFWSAIQTG